MKFLVDKYTCTSTTATQPWFPKDPNDMQNMLIVGGPSSEKEKHLGNLLAYLYGDAASRVKETEYTINNYGSNSTKVRLRHSNYHIVLVPNNSALDKYVLQEVVVEFCRKNDLIFYPGKTRFKTVVIHRADNLSEQAQFCLRRVMETISHQCRFLLLSTNPCNFIMPIRSRFIQVNIPTPSERQVREFLNRVVAAEGIEVPEDTVLDRRDSRAALWKLESYRHCVPYHCWWERLTDHIVEHIVGNPMRNMKSILDVREKLGQLFVSNIESHMVLLRMMRTLFKEVSQRPAHNDIRTISRLAVSFACFDCRLKNATRYILHMEALIHSLCFILHVSSSSSKSPVISSSPALL